MPRPPRTGKQRSDRRIQFRVSDEEHAELEEATTELECDRSTFIREALAEALGDWRERRVFERRQRSLAVDVERRSGRDRRREPDKT